MRLIPLGTSGVHLPEVGVGTYLYTGGPDPLRRAIDLGGTFIDTAPLYGTESVVGQAISGRRDEVFVATKVGGHELSYDGVVSACDRSLRALDTDRIDLYQVHWANPTFPIGDTVAALEDLIDAGKVRFIGLSNFNEPEAQAARAATTRHEFVSNQVQYSLIYRLPEHAYNPNMSASSDQQRMLAYCAAQQMAVIGWGPLGLGRLLDPDADDSDASRVLHSIAQRTGKTPAQVAINWSTAHGVIAIPKSNSAERIAENLGASGWRLDDADIAALDEAFPAQSPPDLTRPLWQFLCEWAASIESQPA